MSILTEQLPNYITVKGVKCPVKTDFKVWLMFSKLISNGIDTTEKLFEVLKLVFYELPPNLKDAVNALLCFYSHSAEENAKSNEKAEQKNIFDFEYDGDLIYSAFYQQYKIDLTAVEMHWWKFKALLGGLSDDTHFIKVMQFRSIDISKIKDREQRQYYQKMKLLYKLPDNRSEEQKEKYLNSIMENVF